MVISLSNGDAKTTGVQDKVALYVSKAERSWHCHKQNQLPQF